MEFIVNGKFVTEVLSVTEIMLRMCVCVCVCIYIYIYMCVCVLVCVNVTFLEALPGEAMCCIVCCSVQNEISCTGKLGLYVVL